MAVEFDVDKAHLKRGTTYLLDPRTIRLNPKFNARHDLPQIEDLIASFQQRGQLQACAIGNENGVPFLRMGHRRWRTAIHLTENAPHLCGYWPLVCTYYPGSAEDAFLAAIAENHQREASTAIDDAYNIATLEEMGKSIEEIAIAFCPAAIDNEEKMKEAIAFVKQRKPLVKLTEESQRAFREGRLKPTAAVALARMDRKAQNDLLDGQSDAKRIKVSAVKAIAASVVAPDPEASAELYQKNTDCNEKPSSADLIAFFDSVSTDRMDAIGRICGLNSELLSGDMFTKSYIRELERVIEESTRQKGHAA